MELKHLPNRFLIAAMVWLSSRKTSFFLSSRFNFISYSSFQIRIIPYFRQEILPLRFWHRFLVFLTPSDSVAPNWIMSTYEIEASSKKVEVHLVLTRTRFCFSVLSSCNFLRISSASFSCCEGLVVSALVTCIEQGLPDSSDSWGPYLLRARCYDDSIFQIFPLPLKDNDINEWGNDRKTALSPYPYSPSSTILSK